MKIELKDGSFIEIPDGFKDANEFIGKFNELNGQVPALQQQAALVEKYKAWGDPETLEARLNAHIEQQKAAAIAAAKAEGATPRQAAAAGDAASDSLWSQWETMTPAQQGQTLKNIISQEVGGSLKQQVEQLVQGYWQQAQTQLNTATGGTQQQFDLLARALDAKLANPKLDLTKMWDQMGQLAKATPEQLMQMAMKSATADDDWKSKLENERAKWQEESDKKQNAEKLQVLNSDSFNKTFKREEDRPSLNQPGGEDKMRAKILGDALQNGSITSNQL